jgi:signal transduction histidine kinase
MDMTSQKIGGTQETVRDRVWPFYVFLAFFFFIFVVLAAHNYRTIGRELTDSVMSRRLSIAELSATTLSEKFDSLIGIGIALATRVKFRELIAQEKWDEAVEILRDVPKDFPFIERLHLTHLDGTKMAELPELEAGVGGSFVHREWYQYVSRNLEPYISPVFQRFSPPKRNIFAVAVPITDADNNPLGILVMHTDLEGFFTWAGEIEIGPGGFVYVVDSKGQLAYHPRFPAQGDIISFSEVPAVQQVLQGRANVEITYNPIEKEQRITAYVPARYGWGVVAQQPAAVALEFKNRQMRRILTGYALILLFCMLALWLAYKLLKQQQKAEQDRRIMTELEQRVAERTAQLEATNKELESFSYTVSHDLRSPLRAIEGFSLILDEEYGSRLDAEGQRLLGVVKDNARSMSVLIDDLLAFSRLGRQAIKPVEINMNQLVKEISEEVISRPGTKTPELVVQSLPGARADHALLRQVWLNLFSNAVKYSSNCVKPVIEIGGHAGEKENIYFIRDNGAGFDMQYYNKLFSVFQRLHRADEYPGTGIGLAIVHRVITRHGGRIWAEGKINEGATFYFTLPGGQTDEC